jgi:phenylacetate-CoA ligase
MERSEYFDEKIETANREEIEELQFRKLKILLNKVYHSNPFYKRKFEEFGISPLDINSLDDLPKLPFTTKREFEEDQERNPVFGTNLSEPLENFVRYFQTTGTTGKPLKWLETKESWQWRGRCAAMALWAAGVRPSDIVLFPFGFGPHAAFWGLFEGVYHIGGLAIAAGGWDTLQRVKCIFENNVTVVCCTPTYALRMAEVANENGINLKESSVRITIHAGEPGALIPSIRNKIKDIWNAIPFDYPGLTEIGAYGIHCKHQESAVHVNESEFIIEVIDPKTQKPVPNGGIGELVLTNLGRGCSPSIRFRTGDLVKIKKGYCPCGRTFKMLDGGVLGRSDDMIIIRGINIFPPKVGEVVEKHLVLGEEYQMIVSPEKGGEFKILIELLESRNKEEILNALKKDLRGQFEIRMEVEVVPPGTLPRSEYKSRRLIDKRKEVV